MEGSLQKFPRLKHPTDSSDAKFVSGLSTILVATIQEAKDRISQIEYIFCSQLFPNFQSKFKSWQKVYLEAREAADAWEEKEKDQLLQIKKLEFEKEQVLKEYQSLKMQKENFTCIENVSPTCVHKLQEELKRKTDEVSEGREVQQNLQKLLDSKASLILFVSPLMKKAKLACKFVKNPVYDALGVILLSKTFECLDIHDDMVMLKPV